MVGRRCVRALAATALAVGAVVPAASLVAHADNSAPDNEDANFFAPINSPAILSSQGDVFAPGAEIRDERITCSGGSGGTAFGGNSSATGGNGGHGTGGNGGSATGNNLAQGLGGGTVGTNFGTNFGTNIAGVGAPATGGAGAPGNSRAGDAFGGAGAGCTNNVGEAAF